MEENLIFLVGMMGSGKSYTGRRLAMETNRSFLDLDQAIERGEKKSISDIFNLEGEATFRNIEKSYLYQTLQLPGKWIIATGGGAPCFFDNMQWMNQHGHTIWLHVPIPVLVQRLWPERITRPLIAQFESREALTIFWKTNWQKGENGMKWRKKNFKLSSITLKEIESMPIHFEIETDELYLRGESIGIEKGIEKDIEKGAFSAKVHIVENIIKCNPDWTNEYIAQLCEVSANFVQKVRLGQLD